MTPWTLSRNHSRNEPRWFHQLQPTLTATKDSFLWGAFLTLGPKKPRKSPKFYLRSIWKCEMQTYNNCLELHPRSKSSVTYEILVLIFSDPSLTFCQTTNTLHERAASRHSAEDTCRWELRVALIPSAEVLCCRNISSECLLLSQ